MNHPEKWTLGLLAMGVISWGSVLKHAAVPARDLMLEAVVSGYLRACGY